MKRLLFVALVGVSLPALSRSYIYHPHIYHLPNPPNPPNHPSLKLEAGWHCISNTQNFPEWDFWRSPQATCYSLVCKNGYSQWSNNAEAYTDTCSGIGCLCN